MEVAGWVSIATSGVTPAVYRASNSIGLPLGDLQHAGAGTEFARRFQAPCSRATAVIRGIQLVPKADEVL
jgi:hypothetical protein